MITNTSQLDDLEIRDLYNMLHKMMDYCLSARDKEIILLRAKGHTLDETGKSCELSRQRARQIYNGSIRKLRRAIALHYRTDFNKEGSNWSPQIIL